MPGEFQIAPSPHEEAIALIEGKSVVAHDVFMAMLTELRGRAFAVAGVEGADILQRLRDTIADLPRGENWEDVRGDLADQLSPFLGEGAEGRAELLLRVHGFQAFNAANWRVIQEDADTTHIQYLATEDDRVRDSHLALNGIILPKDDSFWGDHTPPWEWGCRCRIRAINPDLLDEAKAEDENRAPDDKLVMEGPAAEHLRNGQILRGGQAFDVLPDDGPHAFQWHPDNLSIPLEDLRARLDPQVWTEFESYAKGAEISPGVLLWDWLRTSAGTPNVVRAGQPRPPGVAPVVRPDPNAPKSGQEFSRSLRRAAGTREAQAVASANWTPSPLLPADVEAETVRVRAAREANTVQETGGEPLPAPPAALADTLREIQRLRGEEEAALDASYAREDLYYQANPSALEAIRQWGATERAAIRAQFRAARLGVP